MIAAAAAQQRLITSQGVSQGSQGAEGNTQVTDNNGDVKYKNNYLGREVTQPNAKQKEQNKKPIAHQRA
jgi:hypothetical protein